MGASVTLWEATAPVKLPPWHGPPSWFKEWCSNGVSPDGTCGESGISPLPPPSPRAQVHRLPPILRTSHTPPMPGCSKAPRGLFVLSRATSIFTGISISPGPLLRQRSSRYSIRAGRNLPDKEFRYLRTVIVTAAVYWGFGSPPCDSSPSPSSTGQESAPILRLTASQRPVFLVNSRLSPFAAPPPGFRRKAGHPPGVPLLPKLRGQFAEFLNRGSPVHLPSFLGAHLRRFAVRAQGALPRGFSWRPRHSGLHPPFGELGPSLTLPSSGARGGICLPTLGYERARRVSTCDARRSSPRPPIGQTITLRDWNTRQLSIAYALRPRLRPA